MVNAPQMLVWAVGSLEGYANQAELLCVSVDCDTEAVKTFPVERAQELVRSMMESNEGSWELMLNASRMRPNKL